MLRRLVAALLLVAAIPLFARTRAVRHSTLLPVPRSVLWVGAHPDDEAVVAPLLAQWCRDGGARCGILLVTRGEAGPCFRTEGCEPDVASVRSAEAGAASQMFGAESILLTFADGGGVVPPRWDIDPDERAALVTRLADYVEAFRPELVLTFDPRHGTTCHPDHRALGGIVGEALARLHERPALYLLETLVSFRLDPLAIEFSSAWDGALRFDATIPAGAGTAWDAVLRDMERHRSQFDAAWVDAAAAVPERERAVYLAPAAEVLPVPLAPCR
jgi:LmbE family N-acetylglucosaminyl deacetylase